jgi:hypothetical protein
MMLIRGLVSLLIGVAMPMRGAAPSDKTTSHNGTILAIAADGTSLGVGTADDTLLEAIMSEVSLSQASLSPQEELEGEKPRAGCSSVGMAPQSAICVRKHHLRSLT